MIGKSIIWTIGFVPCVAFGQSNQILYLDKSPRNITFGEAAIAIPNAIGTPHLETPTSGLIEEKATEANFGSSNGEFNVEYDTLQDGNEVRRKNEADWIGKSLNFIYFTPVPTLFFTDIKTRLLVTGGIQGNTFEYRNLDEVLSPKEAPSPPTELHKFKVPPLHFPSIIKES